jgi:uncharacterized protein involved in exopolysaccharide biosynthesis
VEQDDAFEPGGIPDALRDPRGMLRRRWRWMLAALLAGLAATTAFALTRQDRYAATATILVATQQIREDLVRTTLQDDLLERIDAMVGEMLSRDNLAVLIEKYDPYPELRESMSMSEIAARVREDIVFRPLEGMNAQRQDPSARLFTLTFTASRPDVAAAFANQLAARLVDRSIERRTQEAGRALDFLRGELERSEREMRELSRKIREFKEQYRGELPGELPANLARLERLQSQRQSLALQIAEANTQVAELLAPSTGATQDKTPEARLTELRTMLTEREGVVTEKHPDIAWLRSQIAELEKEVAAAGEGDKRMPTRAGMIAAGQQTVDELRRQLARTEEDLKDLDERVARTPSRQEELAALEERESVLREAYRDFLRKVQEGALAASLESAQQGERFSVLEQAVPPGEPARSRWDYLAGGSVVSFALALAFGLILELVDPVLVSARQVETESGLAVLGSAPHIS